MKLPFLASFIVLIVWLSYEISKTRRAAKKQEDQFWERESAANRTRRKSLDGLAYITIPIDSLPMDACSQREDVQDCVDVIKTLSKQTIVNLTGYTNTDLKLMYGVPNLPALISYDQSYTMLARTLQKWATLLHEQGLVTEAVAVLEFAVSTHTDVSGTYKLLSSIYRARGQEEKIAGLLDIAATLRSPMKHAIVHALQESDPSDG